MSIDLDRPNIASVKMYIYAKTMFAAGQKTRARPICHTKVRHLVGGWRIFFGDRGGSSIAGFRFTFDASQHTLPVEVHPLTQWTIYLVLRIMARLA